MKNLKPKLIILFGSKAKNQTHLESDADIAVLESKPLDWQRHVKLVGQIAKKFGLNEDKIDLIDLGNAPPLLQYEVAKYGKLLQGKQEDFIRFKVLAWKRYVDTEKFRRLSLELLAKKYG